MRSVVLYPPRRPVSVGPWASPSSLRRRVLRLGVRSLPAAPARVRWPVGVPFLAAPAGASPRCAFSSRRAGPCPLARGRPLPRCAGGCFASVCVLFPPRRPVSVGPWASPSSLRRRVLRLGVRSLPAAPARVRWPVGVPFLAAPAGASPRCAFSSRRAGRGLACGGASPSSLRRPVQSLGFMRVPGCSQPRRVPVARSCRPRRPAIASSVASGFCPSGGGAGRRTSPQNDALAAGGARRSVAG